MKQVNFGLSAQFHFCQKLSCYYISAERNQKSVIAKKFQIYSYLHHSLVQKKITSFLIPVGKYRRQNMKIRTHTHTHTHTLFLGGLFNHKWYPVCFKRSWRKTSGGFQTVPVQLSWKAAMENIWGRNPQAPFTSPVGPEENVMKLAEPNTCH